MLINNVYIINITLSRVYSLLLLSHSAVRWFVVISLFYSIYKAGTGYFTNSIFTKTDDLIRSLTLTISHVQLTIGVILYIQSPVIKYFWKNFKVAIHNADLIFFGMIHILLMITAVTLLTIGSAMTKRKANDKEKFKTMLIWFSIALIIIFIAIPWPFSPLANRPYLRSF